MFVLWPIPGAVAAGIYIDALTLIVASQGNRDTMAPLAVPLFALALIGLAAAASGITGLVLWSTLRRNSMLAALLNAVLWAGLLAFAQSAPGKAFIKSQQAPVVHHSVPPIPACNENPPSGGQDLKTWEFQCAGKNAPSVRND